MKNWIAVAMMALTFVCVPADAAKRFGGGKSMGQQSNQVTQREAVNPATPNGAPNEAPNAWPNAGRLPAPVHWAAPRRPRTGEGAAHATPNPGTKPPSMPAQGRGAPPAGAEPLGRPHWAVVWVPH